MTPLPLLLALALPAAPAPKAEKGLPRDLIDLIPADTAAVLVVDATKIGNTPFGQQLFKELGREQTAGDPVQFSDFAKDAELVLICQFLIDKGFGDFCAIVRHKAGSEIPKKLLAYSEKRAKDHPPEAFGKRVAYSLGGLDTSFAPIDDRTLMFVGATGDDKQIKETRAAAYAERDKPGPSEALRKMLAGGASDDRPVRIYGSHPTKLALSTHLVLYPFGVEDKAIERMGEKLVSYRGGIKVGEGAEVELRDTARDADAATEELKLYEAGGGKDEVVKELRKSAKAVRDGDEVIVTAKLTPAILERLRDKPNK
jgi:hypothetical protein